MKNVALIISLLFFVFFASAQTQTITYTPMTAGGYQFKYIKADSGFNIPNRDTSTGRGTRRGGSFVFDTLHRVFYGWDGIRWVTLGNTTASGIFVDSITVAGNNICQWIAGVPTCYTLISNTTFTGVDSLTYTGNSLCWWKTGIPTCYSITPGIDSVTLVGDQLCQWKAGISTCYTIDGSLLGTFLDSVTVIGNQLCQWKAGVSTCYTINNTSTGVDSITVVDSILCAWSQGFSTCFNLNRPDTVYVADDLYVVWDSTGHQVIHRLHNDGVVSGGIVTSEGCRLLHVTSVSYYLNNGTHYISADITLTDPAADLTLPRTDGIILDTFGLVTIRTGTPSLTPSPPSFNPASEWPLTTFPVTPGVSCLDINSIVIYDENTEYTHSTTGTISADPNNTDNPEHLTKADFVVTYSDGAKIIFTKPSGNDTVFNNSVFRWGFYVNGLFGNQVQMQLFLNGVAVSNNIVVNPYFNILDSNRYQIVGVPAYAFNLPGNTIFNKVVFTLRGNDLSGAKGFYLDWLQLQTGITNPQIDNSNKVDSVTIISGSDYYWIKGVSHLIGTRGGTLQQAYNASIAAGDIPQINGHNNLLFIDSLNEHLLRVADPTSGDNVIEDVLPGNYALSAQRQLTDSTQASSDLTLADSTITFDAYKNTLSDNSFRHNIIVTPGLVKITRQDVIGNVPINNLSARFAIHTDSVATINSNNVAYFDGDTLKRGHISLGGGGTVTNIATGYALSGGPITSTGTILVDSAALSLKYLRIVDTANIRFRPVAGSNITLSGTYPNITIAASAASTPNLQTVLTAGSTLTQSNTINNGGFVQISSNGKNRFDSIGIIPSTYIADSIWFSGTSITFGTGASSVDNSFPYLVANKLGALTSVHGVSGGRMYVEAINSTNIALIPTYSAAKYRWMVLEWGVNDMQLNVTDTATYAAAYLRYLDTCIARGWPVAKILILSPSYIDSVIVPAATTARQALWHTCTPTIASRRGTQYLDIWTIEVAKGGTANLYDGIHPNDYGVSAVYVNPIPAKLGDSVHTQSQSVAINGLTELQKLKLRTIDTAGYKSVPIGIDSSGNVVRFDKNQIITNSILVTQPQGASININGDATFGKTLKAYYGRFTGIPLTGYTGPALEFGYSVSTNRGWINSMDRTGNIPKWTVLGSIVGTKVGIGDTTGGVADFYVNGHMKGKSAQFTGALLGGMTGGVGTEIATYSSGGYIGAVDRPAGTGVNMYFQGLGGKTRIGSLTAPASTVDIAGSLAVAYVGKNTNYSLTVSDHTVEVTTGTNTQTLPTAVGITGRIYVITNSGTGVVTVATTSSQTFVNVTLTPTTLTLAQFNTVTVQSNGANWLRLTNL